MCGTQVRRRRKGRVRKTAGEAAAEEK